MSGAPPENNGNRPGNRKRHSMNNLMELNIDAIVDEALYGKTTDLGVSCLKTMPEFVGYIMNTLFTSPLLSDSIGWSKAQNAQKFKENLSKYTNFKNILRNSLSSRSVCPIIGDDDLATMLETVIVQMPSRLTKGIEDSLAGNTSPELSKLQNLSEWTTSTIEPTQVALTELSSLADIYIIVALNGVSSTTGSIDPIITTLEELKEQATGVNVRGTKAIDAVNKAITDVKAIGTGIYTNTYYAKYGSVIPAGTHMAYEFYGGALHHAIYLGSNVVIEVSNNVVGKEVLGFITIVTLNDFLKRVRNSPSSLFVYKYTNSYPYELIKARALWALGKYKYHLRDANCESFANWVFMNRFQADMCIITPTAVFRSSSIGKGARKRKTRKNKH